MSPHVRGPLLQGPAGWRLFPICCHYCRIWTVFWASIIMANLSDGSRVTLVLLLAFSFIPAAP